MVTICLQYQNCKCKDVVAGPSNEQYDYSILKSLPKTTRMYIDSEDGQMNKKLIDSYTA